MISCDCAAAHVREFLRLPCAIRPFALFDSQGKDSPGELPRCAETDPQGIAMFRIVLRPEETALLCAIRDGLCPEDEVPGSVLLRLMALRMLKCDNHGNPKLTDLAEAALERMRGNIH